MKIIIKILDWSPYPLDLNSLENVWARMKNQFGYQKYAKVQLISQVHQIWNDISEDDI